MRAALFVIGLLSCACVSYAQDTARIEQVMQSFVSQGTFSGAVLVARGSDVIFSKGFGSANRELKIPNTPTTQFRIASITKQFTAAAVLLLEEQGRLRLTDPVRKHLPEAPESWAQMTIFHLLTHTAGLPALGTPIETTAASGGATDRSVAAAVATLMERPLNSAPGAAFAYGNAAYLVLGHLIQRVSGVPYEQFLRARVFDPLGMKDTGFDSPAVLSQRASSYVATPKGITTAPPVAGVVPAAAAGMFSTTEDLLRWQVGLFGGKVLSAASRQKMTTPFMDDYGLGVYVRTLEGRKAITHGGGAPPFANLAHYPESNTTVVVLGNLNIAPASEIAGFLGALAHGDKVLLASEKNAITLSPALLARYAGSYQLENGQSVSVAIEDGRLTLQPPAGNKMTLLAESETSFFLRGANMRFEFISNAAGAVTELVIHQGTRPQRLKRTAPQD